MAISSLSVAKEICRLSDWGISNLQLQKILYLAHMVYMGQQDGDPLIDGNFEAWDYGPVNPPVYHQVKAFGKKPVKNVFHSVPDIADQDLSDFLEGAVDSLSKLAPSRLVAITHDEKGAWAKNYFPGHGAIIPNEDILAEYRMRFDGK